MFFSGLSAKDQGEIARNLATLIKSGLTLNESFDLLIQETESPRVQKILANIVGVIEKGTNLGSALSQHKKVFDPVFIRLVEVGEKSGTLENNLLFLADLMERSSDLRSKIRAAFIYPEIVIVATVALAGSLAVFILPKLIPLFTSFKVALPLPTRILLWLTRMLQQYWQYFLLGIALLIPAISFVRRLEFVKTIYHPIVLRIPFFGRMAREYQLALISQVFYTFIKSGLGIQEVLEGGARSATNIEYARVFEVAGKKVLGGMPLSQALAETKSSLFPREFLTVIAVGERSGTLEKSFFELAEKYHHEVDRKTKNLPTIIEPILLLAIGLSVGFVAISIILPVYQITQGFETR